MKLCLSCNETFEGLDWKCPACKTQPNEIDGFLAFAPDLARAVEGFDEGTYKSIVAAENNGHFWLSARLKLLILALRRYFPAARSLLEIGCGSGYNLSGVQDARNELALTGSEPLVAGLVHSSKRIAEGINLYQIDARRIPFTEEFDVISAFDVLEHIAEDDLVLSEMFRACRHGGGIIITVPQHMWLWSVYDEEGGHCLRYSRKQLIEKVERAGFSCVLATSFVTSLLPALFLRRIIKKNESFRPADEFVISPLLNMILRAMISIDLVLIRFGITLPVGGSLLLVAKKK